MRINAIILCVAAAVTYVFAARPSNSNQYIVQMKLLPGQKSNSNFDGQYMLLEGPPGVLIFTDINEHAGIFTFEQSKAANGSFPALNYITSNYSRSGNVVPDYFVHMDFFVAPHAAWAGVSYSAQQSDKNGLSNRFYLNQTGTNTAQIMWLNGGEKGSTFHQVDWVHWLVCDWWWDAPQLFFVISHEYDPIKPNIPSSCALVTLEAEAID